MKTIATYWHKFWRDKNGHIVIWQKPNFLLMIWLFTVVLQKVMFTGSFQNGISFLGTAVLIIWSYLEITSGKSYFRRMLGVAVLLYIITTHFS